MSNKNKMICTDELLINKDKNGITSILLNNPRYKNALSESLTPFLRKELKKIKKDKNCKLLVLRGVGDSFCSGGNFKKMDMGNGKTKKSLKDKIKDLEKKQLELTGILYNLPIPTVAVITGAAAGAGFSLALSCDIRIGNKNAFFTSNYSRIGLSGDYGISWFLTNLLGPAKSKEIMFLNQRIYAKEALNYGLLNYLYEQKFEENIDKTFNTLINMPQTALRFIKQNINYAMTNNLNKTLKLEAKHLIKSANHKEHEQALTKFMTKK